MKIAMLAAAITAMPGGHDRGSGTSRAPHQQDQAEGDEPPAFRPPEEPGDRHEADGRGRDLRRDRRRSVDQPAEEEEPGDAVGLEAQVVVAADDGPPARAPPGRRRAARAAAGTGTPLEATHRRHEAARREDHEQLDDRLDEPEVPAPLLVARRSEVVVDQQQRGDAVAADEDHAGGHEREDRQGHPTDRPRHGTRERRACSSIDRWKRLKL